MKLLRYGPKGQEKPGMLDAAGVIRDLSGVVPDIAGDVLSDAGLAKKVIQYDTSVDNNNRMVISELKELMKTDTSLVEPALHCFSASRHIERIADHAENIAEEVVYLVDGDIVRHKHGNFSLGKYSKQDAETKDPGN